MDVHRCEWHLGIQYVRNDAIPKLLVFDKVSSFFNTGDVLKDWGVTTASRQGLRWVWLEKAGQGLQGWSCGGVTTGVPPPMGVHRVPHAAAHPPPTLPGLTCLGPSPHDRPHGGIFLTVNKTPSRNFAMCLALCFRKILCAAFFFFF